MTGEIVPFRGRGPETGVISRVRKIKKPMRSNAGPGPHLPQLEEAGFRERELPVGTVIRFDLRFPNLDGLSQRYSYAALRAENGRWYTTGSTCPVFGWRWSELCAWVDHQGVLVGKPKVWNGKKNAL